MDNDQIDRLISFNRDNALGRVSSKVRPIFNNIESIKTEYLSQDALFLLELIADIKSALIDANVKL